MASTTTRKLISRLGAESRFHPESDATEIRRDLAASRIEDYVARVVDAAPPLTPEQRDRIAALLRPAGGGE